MLHHNHYIPHCESRLSDLRIMANISFRSFWGLLLGIQFWLNAEGQGRMIEKHALIGQQVNLTCYSNSPEDVTWLYDIGENDFVNIYTCTNDRCELIDAETIRTLLFLAILIILKRPEEMTLPLFH